ncbi:MAG TPA: hypothetical protein PKD07_18845, partial [Microthrixaceae bacterium]|nr:hypothetical protein [Microthrixaceae bacterium]
MLVRAPASSANLGSGFDVLGLALDVPFWIADEPLADLLAMDDRHPAWEAHRQAGGDGDLWWRSPIPPGRGMGFSGAARVAGAMLALVGAGEDERTARDGAFEVASTLEGHPDNAAASAYGGVVAAAGGRVVPVHDAFDAVIVLWWPDSSTSTRKARAVLPAAVPFGDAVFNVGRVALLVAAFAAGDRDAMAVAVQDRLHQDARLALSPGSGEALDAMRAAGPIAAWLGGSGPTVAALVDRDRAEQVAAALPPGHRRVVEI